MDHAPLSIRMFGHLYNTSAQAEECEHQENTKSPWKLTNKRDAEMQMTKTTERREVLAYLVAMDPIQAIKITTRKTKASQAPEAQWARARTRVLARTEEPLAPRHLYLLTGNNNYNYNITSKLISCDFHAIAQWKSHLKFILRHIHTSRRMEWVRVDNQV